MAFKKNRQMKVYETSGKGYKRVPQIRISGQWLQELGFSIGDTLNVECEGGKLIITLRDEFIDKGADNDQ